jgi:hypothetical protein
MNRLLSLLITEEIKSTKSSDQAAAALRVGEKMRNSLSTLMGPAGFCALLMRARAISVPEAAWLSRLEISKDGQLEGWNTATEGLSKTEAAAGAAILIGHVLDLLDVFIGQDLTLRLAQEVWPRAKLRNLKPRQDL